MRFKNPSKRKMLDENSPKTELLILIWDKLNKLHQGDSGMRAGFFWTRLQPCTCESDVSLKRSCLERYNFQHGVNSELMAERQLVADPVVQRIE